MSALEKDNFWMCFTPYKPEIVGQEEKIIFGPTTLHGDAIRMKCEQMGLKNIGSYFEEILENAHSVIAKNKFITEEDLELLIKRVVTS